MMEGEELRGGWAAGLRRQGQVGVKGLIFLKFENVRNVMKEFF